MKNRKHFYYLVLLFITIAVSFQAKSQISQGGQPYSFSKATLNNSQVPFSMMPAVDVAARMAEDVYNDPQKSIPWRFGENIAVNLNLSNSGTWDIMPNGDKLWRLGINAPGALSINLIFDHYNIPTDAKLFIYSPSKSEVIGAFTDFNNQADGMFATTLMRGDSIILEYFEPSNAVFPGEISINNVTHGYRNAFDYAKAFGSSGTCQNNVACPISAGWTNEVNSACMLVSGGNGFCSGSLVNNTSNDGTPYILTANHCYSNPSTWVFWFNWQSSACANPGASPTYNSITGATLKAQNVASDFCLVQMNTTPPAAYNVYYAGWNNNATAATSTTCIHHPAGDIKKFSTAGAATSVAAYNAGNGNAECWNVSWTSGCTEGGSSGSPLFDQNHLIVGQLYGGPSACGVAASSMNDYYGKFSISWNTGTTAATRLKDWLDPTNTGATTLPGFNPVSPQAPVANFSANVTTSCTGSITFTDMSVNSPTSWIWYFGDGTTATTQNPTHAYTASGTYTVSLKSTNAIGNDSIAKVSYITINMPTIPTVTGGSSCGTGTVNLSATGSGTLQWYAAATGGTALTTGTSYTTPSISTTTSYYVENHIVQPSAYVGPLSTFAAGAYSNTGYTLNFNCLAPCTLVSVAVNKQTAGNVLIQLTTSTGTVLQSGTFAIVAGASRVTLNWPLTAGTGLKLVSPGNVGFWRVTTGGTFPYTLAGLVSITSCSSTTRYGSFFDWEIKEPDCISSRVPVVATINALPTATATPAGSTAICSGNSVLLNANTGTGLTYQWLLNGANISGATSASYSANQAGSFTVNVTNSCGNTTSTAVVVTVGAAPTATITPAGSTTICSGNSVVLNGNTGTGLTYQWLLNGSNISGATSASYTANQAGNFTLNVTNTCGNITSTPVAVTLNSLPSAVVSTTSPTDYCGGQPISSLLNANTGTGLSYQWQLNGSNIAGAISASYTATSIGNFTVIITNTCGNTTSNTIAITTNASTPTATITPVGSTTFCSGNSVVLNANTGAGYTYQWLLNGSNISGATSQSYTANQAGNYTVSIINTCGNATSSPVTTTVNPLPTATISTSSQTDYCGGQPISAVLNANTGTGLSYQWQLNGVNIGGATTSTYTATSIGNFTSIVTNTCGNTTSNTIAITTTGSAPTATITPAGPTTFCSGNSVILNANTGTGFSYQWLLNGSNISSATSASYTANLSGNYTVLVTNSCGNITSLPVAVTVNAALNTTITPAGNTTVCFGSTVLINAPTGTNYTYQWQLNGIDIPGATSPSYTATQTGNYSVNITDGVCSGSSISIPVAINPVPTTPVISLSNDTLTSTTGFTYQWYYAILNAPISGANNQTYIPTLSGDYYVIVTDANGCSSLQSNTLNVTITGIAGFSESGFSIYPNPTNDFVNIAFNSSTNIDFRLKIINMIGMTIFDEVFSQVNSLNKTIDLTEFASGMYYINIQMKDKSFNTKIIKR